MSCRSRYLLTRALSAAVPVALLMWLLPLPAFAEAGLPAFTATPAAGGGTNYTLPLQTLLFMTALGFLPAVLLMMTSFTRIVIVLSLLRQAIGVQHAGVADTIGVGTPRKVQRAMEATLTHYELADVSGHFHDTYGQALANTVACLEMGIWQYDSSSAGLGGCPYAKGATGNVATEDVVYLLHGMGIETGIDLDKLIDAGVFISNFLQRKPNSRAATALLNKRAA